METNVEFDLWGLHFKGNRDCCFINRKRKPKSSRTFSQITLIFNHLTKFLYSNVAYINLPWSKAYYCCRRSLGWVACRFTKWKGKKINFIIWYCNCTPYWVTLGATVRLLHNELWIQIRLLPGSREVVCIHLNLMHRGCSFFFLWNI